MGSQNLLIVKSRWTKIALVDFFSLVSFDMLTQLTSYCIIRWADFTSKWLCSRVSDQMSFKMCSLREGSLTDVAVVWLFFGVNSFMHRQSGFTLEGRRAQFTFKRLCSSVYDQVSFKMWSLSECFVADLTLKWLFFSVDSFMDYQVLFHFKS